MEKRCSACGLSKPLEDFSRQKLGKHGRRASCKVCQKAYNDAWRIRSANQIRERNRTYRLQNRDKHLAYNTEWNKRNRKRMNEIVVEWRLRNPEKAAAIKNAGHVRRKAWKRHAAGTIYATTQKVQARIQFHGHRCYYCGGPYESIDHRIPLSRGGSHWPANLVPACMACNMAKSARTEREFKQFRAA